MRVSTDIPCGNGIVRQADHQQITIEMIAFSKHARYACFEISDIHQSITPRITLLPDSQFHRPSLQKMIGSRLWLRRLPEEGWQAIPPTQCHQTSEAFSFILPLNPGDRVQISTEPPRPYTRTCEELFDLAHRYPHQARLHLLGTSIEERPIFLLRLTEDIERHGAPGQETRPVILLVSGEHATEFAGEEITRGMLTAALESNASGKSLRERFILDFVLNANPDGNIHGWHQYNARDWSQHDYTPRVDRSWHHEFDAYLSHQEGVYADETVALGNWIDKTHPALVHTAHSWECGDGSLGAYRPHPDHLSEHVARELNRLDHGVLAAADALGIPFHIKMLSSLCSGHLPDHMSLKRDVPAYSLEGNPNVDRATLQAFGRQVLQAWLGSTNRHGAGLPALAGQAPTES